MMSVQVSYKKQSIFALFLILVIIIAIEIISISILEINDSCYQSLSSSQLYENFSDEKLKIICKDYQSTIHFVKPFNHLAVDQFSTTVNVNSDGFRGIETFESNDGTYKIFLTGGSTAFGIYASEDENTISGELEKLFHLNGYDIEVINAGVNGAFSSDEYFLIKTKILEYNPDFIITFTGWNDLETSSEEKSGIHTLETEISNNILYLQKYTKIDDFQSYLSRILDKNLSSTIDSEIKESDIIQRSKLWQKNWNEICELGNEQKFETIIALQPLLGTGNKQLSNWEQKNYDNFNQEKVLNEYQFFIDNLKNINNCTETLDLTHAFDITEETIFQDTGHFGDKGNKIIAEKIYYEIIPIIASDYNLNKST